MDGRSFYVSYMSPDFSCDHRGYPIHHQSDGSLVLLGSIPLNGLSASEGSVLRPPGQVLTSAGAARQNMGSLLLCACCPQDHKFRWTNCVMRLYKWYRVGPP
jgi:hypothetical protein